VFRLCSESFGYCDNPSASISYEGLNLKCLVWFNSVDNMRSFYENVRKSHEYYCEAAQCPPLEFGDIDFSMKSPLNPLTPVLSDAYIATDSESPEQSNAGSFACGVSFASISTPDIFFRLVEDPCAFEEIKPCACHIADAALFKELDGDMENRLYLSQDLHSMFDGRQTTDSIPHVGIYFVSFDGRETVEHEGQALQYDRVTIGFETPYQGTVQKIKFKKGSSVINGAMHTFVHVRSHEKFKRFLDLKYAKTMCSWDSRDVSYTHKIYVEVDDVCVDLAKMSVAKMEFKCSECGKICSTQRGLRSHVGTKACRSSLKKVN
jgi:hypothetical protein